MGELAKLTDVISKRNSDKTETYAGKHTARVTQIFNQEDGSTIKATRKINQDGSITDKIERRYK